MFLRFGLALALSLVPVTHLQRRLQQFVYPCDLLAKRHVLHQVHGRWSPGFGKVCADKRIRVIQELDPAGDGGHDCVNPSEVYPPGGTTNPDVAKPL